MADTKPIKGFEAVKANLNKQIMAIKGRSMAGLLDAAVIVRRDMDRTPPMIPIDTGNLRHSWFVTPQRTVSGPSIIIGFTANYAVFVHEMVDRGKGINWSRPGSGPKFFETSLLTTTPEMLMAIQKRAYIT